MTIGVQGEWGSGKTSLLNQIWNDLEIFNREDDSIDDFKQIWINFLGTLFAVFPRRVLNENY